MSKIIARWASSRSTATIAFSAFINYLENHPKRDFVLIGREGQSCIAGEGQSYTVSPARVVRQLRIILSDGSIELRQRSFYANSKGVEVEGA